MQKLVQRAPLLLLSTEVANGHKYVDKISGKRPTNFRYPPPGMCVHMYIYMASNVEPPYAMGKSKDVSLAYCCG